MPIIIWNKLTHIGANGLKGRAISKKSMKVMFWKNNIPKL
jgi:hypothetical protein